MSVDNLEITQILFIPIRPKENLIGFVQITLNNAIFLDGIAVYLKKDTPGYRLTFPTRNMGSRQIPVHYPTNEKISNYFLEKATEEIEKYYDRLGEDYNGI